MRRHKSRLRNECALWAAIGSAVLLGGATAKAAVIADWTFETSQPTTAGPLSPEIGSGSATGSHSGASTYSSPAGNASTHSFSSTNWATGDYYQFSASSTGFQGITFSYDQTSSNTGPGNFQLEYSTDGAVFTNVGSTTTVLANAAPNTAWNPAGTRQANFTFTSDLSGITALDNQATIFFRIADATTTSANGGTTASGGTDRVDNVVISAGTTLPEPTSLAALLLGGMALTGRRRKWRGHQHHRFGPASRYSHGRSGLGNRA